MSKNTSFGIDRIFWRRCNVWRKYFYVAVSKFKVADEGLVNADLSAFHF